MDLRLVIGNARSFQRDWFPVKFRPPYITESSLINGKSATVAYAFNNQACRDKARIDGKLEECLNNLVSPGINKRHDVETLVSCISPDVHQNHALTRATS